MAQNSANPSPAEKPQVGQAAPAIEAPTAAGGTFSLESSRGRWVTVYFYPRANTPG